jgi:hypothetical protein
LLAFFGISAFAVLGAGVALYSFQRVDKALALITQRREAANPAPLTALGPINSWLPADPEC